MAETTGNLSYEAQKDEALTNIESEQHQAQNTDDSNL